MTFWGDALHFDFSSRFKSPCSMENGICMFPSTRGLGLLEEKCSVSQRGHLDPTSEQNHFSPLWRSLWKEGIEVIDRAHKRSHPQLNLGRRARGGCTPDCLGSLAGWRCPSSRPSRVPPARRSSWTGQLPGHLSTFSNSRWLQRGWRGNRGCSKGPCQMFPHDIGWRCKWPESEEPTELARGVPEPSGRWLAGDTHLKGALQAWKITLLKISLLGLSSFF